MNNPANTTNPANFTVNPYRVFLIPDICPLIAPVYWDMETIKQYKLDKELLFPAHRRLVYHMKMITALANSRGIFATDHTVDSLWEAVVQSYCGPAECSGPALTLLTNKVIWSFSHMDSLRRVVTATELEYLCVNAASRYTERVYL